MNLNHVAKKPFFDLFYRSPCMPQMLRAALYDASLIQADGTPRGAAGTIMLKNQQSIAASKDVNFAVKQVDEIKRHGNHITTLLSYSDLIQLGGYAAVEYCGGPSMIFRMGREDVTSEADSIQHQTEGLCATAESLGQLSLEPEEYVALMGNITIGFVGDDKKGPKSRWCMNPYVFDNTYFQELMLGDKSKYFKNEYDYKLMESAEGRQWVQAFAEDQDLFFLHYAKAHVKLSELSQETNLHCEFEQSRQNGGEAGFREPSRVAALIAIARARINGEELDIAIDERPAFNPHEGRGGDHH